MLTLHLELIEIIDYQRAKEGLTIIDGRLMGKLIIFHFVLTGSIELHRSATTCAVRKMLDG